MKAAYLAMAVGILGERTCVAWKEMAHEFNKLGIRFRYPENWVLDEREADEVNPAVTVYAPDGGFWSVTMHAVTESPAHLSDAALKAMREVYSDLDAEDVHEEIAGRELVGFDMNFYCLDLTNTAHVRSYRTDHATCVVLWQAEDREYDEIADVFRAMTVSLVGGS